MSAQKANRAETMKLVKDTLESNTCDPADELIAMGTALIKIGETLQGLPVEDARRIMHAVQILEGYDGNQE